MRQHPDKTFIGRTERTFDFLGYQFDETGLIGLLRLSIARFSKNITSRIASGSNPEQIAQYVRRWSGWAFGGLSPCLLIKEQESKELAGIHHP